jgi:hypothetical protein
MHAWFGKSPLTTKLREISVTVDKRGRELLPEWRKTARPAGANAKK